MKYANTKTVQLSDAFKIKLYISVSDYGKIQPFLSNCRASVWVKTGTLNANKCIEIELPECTSFTLPEISIKSEEFTYGNNSKLMLIPDYDKPDDLKIELFEHYDAINPFNENEPIGVVELLVNLFLSKLFDARHFAYKLLSYIKELHIDIYSNDMTRILYRYAFKELKLTTYDKYTLDYSAANLCKYTLSFSYNTYMQYLHGELDADDISFKESDITINPDELVDEFDSATYDDVIISDNMESIAQSLPQSSAPGSQPNAPADGVQPPVPGSSPATTPDGSTTPAESLTPYIPKNAKEKRLIDILEGKIKATYKGKTDTGLMGETIDLDVLYKYAKSKGYDLTKMSQVQKFMFDHRVFSKGSLSQCTRGTALTHQILDYARDVENGKDRSKTKYYESSTRACWYDITRGTTGNKHKEMTNGLNTDFTKDLSYNKKEISTKELTSLGDRVLQNSGDYITYQVKKAGGGYSFHIVSLYIDENGKRHYYSDYDQTKTNERSGGVNSYKAGATIFDVKVYNYHGK